MIPNSKSYYSKKHLKVRIITTGTAGGYDCFAAGLLELQKVAAVDIRSVFQLNSERFGVTQSQRGDIVEQRALRGNSCIIVQPLAPRRQCSERHGSVLPDFPDPVRLRREVIKVASIRKQRHTVAV